MIETREALIDDLPRIKELAKPMWLMHGDEEPVLLRREYLENYDIDTYFRKCFDEPDNNRIFVAESDGLVIGIVRAEIVSVDGMFIHQKALYIDDLVVDEGHRRKGIAESLLRRVEDFAKQKEIHILKARVYDFNKFAQGLFMKGGFKNLYSDYYKLI